VNVWSGLTQTNYKELTDLYNQYKGSDFEILGFPSNQFGGQEPGSNEQIKEFACTRFKAEFPLFDKINVNGQNQAPLYKYLKSQKGGLLGNGIKWNFTKFLVDKDGKVVERYAPITSPSKIEKDIKKLLNAWTLWAEFVSLTRLGKKLQVSCVLQTYMEIQNYGLFAWLLMHFAVQAIL
jgi:glutathione peroxidase